MSGKQDNEELRAALERALKANEAHPPPARPPRSPEESKQIILAFLEDLRNSLLNQQAGEGGQDSTNTSPPNPPPQERIRFGATLLIPDEDLDSTSPAPKPTGPTSSEPPSK